MPALITIAVSDETTSTAKSGGNITSDGGAAITARGVCWSKTAKPTISDSKTSDGTGLGVYRSYLVGLMPNTIYFIRAYATNSAGTGYGTELRFSTLPPYNGSQTGVNDAPITDSDGNVYSTVIIGSQIWMKENLRSTRYRNGDVVVTGLSDDQWGTTTNGAYAVYGNDTAKDTVYGKLYNWYAVTDPRNIAPEGWHIPTEAEWKTLINHLGGWYAAGNKLKEDGLAHWLSPNSGANNRSGFTALPGGGRHPDGSFSGIGGFANWWSSTESDSIRAKRTLLLGVGGDEVVTGTGYKNAGYSVRCIKD